MRRHALGNFRDAAQEMSQRPGHDGLARHASAARRASPNENYARELMELFSLGIGNYTEKDIREAARRSPARDQGRQGASSTPRQHDDGEKTVLGKTGKFKGEDIVRICLEQPACPRFIVRKLYRFLVSEIDDAAGRAARPARRAVPQERLRHRQAGRDDPAVEPVLLAARVPRADQVAGRVRPRHRPRRWKARVGTLPLARGAGGAGPECCSTRRRSRAGTAAGLAQRPDAAVPPEPGPGPDLDRGRALRPPLRPGRAAARSTARRRDEELVDFFLDLFLQGDVPAAAREQAARLPAAAAKDAKCPVYWTADDVAEPPRRGPCATWC